MSPNEQQARLTDLETRLAYQEDTLHTLDALVAEQSRRIALLEARLEQLARRLHGLQHADPGEAPDALHERPPHY